MIFRCFLKIEAYGRDDLPRGGALLVCNHLSWIDGLLIGITCPRAPRMIAYAAYVQHPMTRWFCKFTKVIPIEPGSRQAVGAIREAREAIRNGEYVCIFAEGVLSRGTRGRPPLQGPRQRARDLRHRRDAEEVANRCVMPQRLDGRVLVDQREPNAGV